MPRWDDSPRLESEMVQTMLEKEMKRREGREAKQVERVAKI